jgi:hypothetical protein
MVPDKGQDEQTTKNFRRLDTMNHFETVGSGSVDEAKPDSKSPYEAYSEAVTGLRKAGYYSENLELHILNYLERLAWARDLEEELSRLGYDRGVLQGKSWRELSQLLAEATAKERENQEALSKGTESNGENNTNANRDY